ADVIVGFPAETEERFENTYRFLNELPVAYLHAFTYSERPHTAAVDHFDRMGGASVPRPERSRRNRMLRLLSQKKQHAFYNAHLGTVRPVLWESYEKDGVMYGFTDNYIKVRRPHDPARAGTIEAVQLGSIAEDGTVIAEDPAFVSIL
ncbi:MAG: tRNA (N(6)-L-threonylcarbamoyladenosine(37)-C(2))-methylthiotransferase MtaB, partial [Rhodothermales bacterium]